MKADVEVKAVTFAIIIAITGVTKLSLAIEVTASENWLNCPLLFVLLLNATFVLKICPFQQLHYCFLRKTD